MRNGNVLISGAGPAGMMLAYWLGRHGFSPTVVERAPAPRDGGQAVDVRGAAIEVAGRTGILDELRRARTGTRGMSYVNSTGKSLASMNAASGVIDAADVEIVRGDLVRILHHKATTDNVRVHLRRFHHRHLPECRQSGSHLRAGAITRVRPGSGCRRVALERARARLRPRIPVHPLPGPIPGDLHHPQRSRPRPLAADPRRSRQVRDHHQRPGEHRGQGDILLRLPTAGLRPSRHPAAAGHPRRRVQRRAMGSLTPAESDAQRPRLLLRLSQPDPHGRQPGSRTG